MEDRLPILLAFECVRSYVTSCPIDPSINGNAKVLGNVQNALQCLESFLTRQSTTFQQDHVTTSGISSTSPINSVSAANNASSSKFPECVQTVRANEEASGVESLPILSPNVDFDDLTFVASSSANIVTPTSAFFDYTLYAAEDHTQAVALCESRPEKDGLGPNQTSDTSQVMDVDTSQCETRDHHNFEDPEQDNHAVADHADEHQDLVVRDVNQSNLGNPHGAGDTCPVTTDHPTAPVQADLDSSRKNVESGKKRKAQGKPQNGPHAKTRKARAKPQSDPGSSILSWGDLDPIVAKVERPDVIHQCLMNQAGEHACEPRIQDATRLFFLFAGPLALHRVRDALLASSDTERIDIETTRGRVRSLHLFHLVHPVKQRTVLAGLYRDRARYQEEAAKRREDHLCSNALHKAMTCAYPQLDEGREAAEKREGDARREALRTMLTCAYPQLTEDSKEYQEKKRDLQKSCELGRTFSISQKSFPGAVWMFPLGFSLDRLRRLPVPLVQALMELLLERRGTFLRQINDLLGQPVADVVAGKRATRPWACNGVALTDMKKQPMDSDYFIQLSRRMASTMSRDTCPAGA